MTSTIEWQVLPERSPRVRWTVALFVGLVLGGGFALPAIAVLSTTGSSPTSVAGTLLVGPSVLAGGLARYRSARERTPYADAVAIDAAGVRWLPVAGVVAAVVTVLADTAGEQPAINAALAGVAVGALGFVLVQSLRGSGRFDPERETATVEGRVYDLGRAPTTPIRLGSLTVLLVRRPAPDVFQRYDLLAMPTDVYSEVARATQETER